MAAAAAAADPPEGVSAPQPGMMPIAGVSASTLTAKNSAVEAFDRFLVATATHTVKSFRSLDADTLCTQDIWREYAYFLCNTAGSSEREK